MAIILFGIISLAVIGLVLGAVIGIAAKLFKVEVDPRIGLVLELLPNANCGGCGKAGCADFARAVVNGELPPSKCPVSSQAVIATIAKALGIEVGSGTKMAAVVLCGGDKNQSKIHVLYNGVNDCASAALIAGGPKGCQYGCLGMGSCARSCPFGAIEMINNLAVLHDELCVGCGNCVKACPRGVIKLVPATARVHVYCNSPEKGITKKQVCSVGCIGCRKCVKAAEEGQFKIDGIKVSVNYEAETLPGEDIVEKAGCPSKCLLTEKQHLENEYNELAERLKKGV